MEPSLALQQAIFEVLFTDTAVSALVSTRIYDFAPENIVFPYISIGEAQVVADPVDCIDGSDIYIQIDVWSKEVGFPEVKEIAGAIRNALNDLDVSLSGNHLISFDFETTRFLSDPDKSIRHAAMQFRALTEPF